MRALAIWCAIASITLVVHPVNGQNIWPPEDVIEAESGSRLIKVVKERYYNGEWEEVNRETHSYDEGGLLVEKEFYTLFGEEWRVSRREKYSYAEGQLVGVLKEDKRINVFHPTEQRRYSYVDDQLSSWTIDAYGPGAQVIPVFRFSHEYSVEDSVSVETILQEQSVNGTWKEVMTVVKKTDDEGRFVSQSKTGGYSDHATPGERFQYEYDEQGELVGRRWMFHGEDGWMVPSDERYIYLEDGTTIIESLRSIGGETTKTHRIILSHDDHGNVVSRSFQGWKVDDWVDGRRETFIYETSE